MPAPIRTVEEFFAHAIAIEREAGDRYAEFAEYFRDRGEDVLAGLCRSLAAIEREHLELLVQASEAMELPAIAADGYRWLDAGAPETGAREVFYRIAAPHQLLEVALQAEHRAHDFFRWIQDTSPERAVRAAAAQMAAEEAEHIRWVRHALEYRGVDARQSAGAPAP
jgi:rubrerythrin